MGGDKPLGRVIGGLERPGIAGQSMPRRETSKDLRSVENGRGDGILLHLPGGECPIWELDREEESHGTGSSLFEPGIVKLLSKSEERRDDVSGRLRIRRTPAAVERISSADAAIAHHILGPAQPLDSRLEMVTLGQTAAAAALATHEARPDQTGVLGPPGSCAPRWAYQLPHGSHPHGPALTPFRRKTSSTWPAIAS